jgi:hypothetical protein
MRMYVDYRKLNDLTRKDRTPLRRIDGILDSLYGAHYFNTLDMYNKGYHRARRRRSGGGPGGGVRSHARRHLPLPPRGGRW